MTFFIKTFGCDEIVIYFCYHKLKLKTMTEYKHTTKATIILEIDVDVTGVYHKEIGATYLTPPESAYFEIQKVEYEGIDITKLLDAAKFDFEDMEQDILEELN